MRRLHQILLCWAAGLLTSATAWACNIPVFRYALERWEPDRYQLLVVADELAEEHRTRLQNWRELSSGEDAALNLEILLATDTNAASEGLRDLWEALQEEQSKEGEPVVTLRSAPVRGQRRTLWQGKLSQFDPAPWFNSPLRRRMIERLLAGDSAVWLLFPAEGAEHRETTEAIRQSLERELERLGEALPFPSGVGEAGSELYSEVPFTIRFSVLVSQHESERELLTLLSRMTNGTALPSETMVVPVFGRGRALEVFHGSQVTPELIGEVSEFLTSACSCQVKQSNPGFDLPLAMVWRSALFADLLPPTETVLNEDLRSAGPAYVAIPSGNSGTAGESAPEAPEALEVGEADTLFQGLPVAEPIEVENPPVFGQAAPLLLPAGISEDSHLPLSAERAKQELPVPRDVGPVPLLRWTAYATLALGGALLYASWPRR